MLLNLTKNLREIVSQYPAPEKLSAEEQVTLALRFKAVLQHYIWFHKDVKHPEITKFYRKLSLYFHPDKFDNDINRTEPSLLQKQDVTKIASFFKKEDDNVGKAVFFKIISDVYTGEFDSSLGTLEQALVKPVAAQPKKTETSTKHANASHANSTRYDGAKPTENYYAHQQHYRPRPHYSYYQRQHYSYPKQQPQNERQYHWDWRQEQHQYKPREYTPAELFAFLEKQLTSLKNIDIDLYIEKLTLEVIFNHFIQERKYDCLESLLQYLSIRKRLETNHMNALLDYAIQYKNIDLAKLAIHYGANTVESIYQDALKKYDDDILYILFEALPDNHVLKNGKMTFDTYNEYDFYYINKMCSEWLISPYTYATLTLEQKKLLSSAQIYDYISKNKISVLKILKLNADELQLMQYPGFDKFFKKIGDFDKALDALKRKRAVLSQPVIHELAYRGIQYRYPYQYGHYYSGFIPMDLDVLLSLKECHIENLNNPQVISLIKSDIIGFNEGIYFNERQRDLLKHGWLRQEMYNTTRYPLDILNYVYHLKDEEINLISAYCHVFPFFGLKDYLKLSEADKLKLENFRPILNKYSCTTKLSNGYAFSGLNFPSILKLSSDMITKLAYPHSHELYVNQGEMGLYLLENFPIRFFEENKNAKLEELFNQALFYASQNNMPKFIDLYTQHHRNSEHESLLNALFRTSKNSLNLYTLKNHQEQTLEEVATESKASNAVKSLKGHTYYFDFMYQSACHTSTYVKETAKAFASRLMVAISP